jgi:hypothetical protein
MATEKKRDGEASDEKSNGCLVPKRSFPFGLWDALPCFCANGLFVQGKLHSGFLKETVIKLTIVVLVLI